MTQDIVLPRADTPKHPQFLEKDGIDPMIKSIIKRDGRVVLYEQNKIAAAILKAMEVAGEGDAFRYDSECLLLPA